MSAVSLRGVYRVSVTVNFIGKLFSNNTALVFCSCSQKSINQRALGTKQAGKMPRTLLSYDPAMNELIKASELAKEKGAPAEVIAAIEESLRLAKLREEFADQTSSKDSATCQKIQTDTVQHDWQKAFDEKKTSSKLQPGMMSGHLEGQFLKSILSLQKPKRVLDIGMYTGYSATTMAEVLPDDGQVVTLDREPYLEELVKSLIKDSPHKNKIRIMIGPALESMQKLKDGGEKFDTVFIDAAKNEYEQYLNLCLYEGLLSPGGTIIVDNAFMRGNAYTNPSSPPWKFGAYLKSKTDLHVVLVPLRDGMYLIRRLVDVPGGKA